MNDNPRLKRLLIVLGVVAVAALLYLFVFSSDDSDDPVASDDSAQDAPSDSSDPAAGSAAGDGSQAPSEGDAATGEGSGGGDGSTTTTSPFGPPESFDVFATRNPFEPVIQVTPVTSDGGSTGTGSTTDTTVPGGSGTPSSSVPGGSTGTTIAPSFNPSTGQPVALLDVYVDSDGTTKARVQVGSTVHTVSQGETFAVSYRVVSLDPTSGCGSFVYGDSPFELCEGEQVIK